MIRFVVGPDRSLVPDLAARLPGRGMWLSADRGAVRTALAKNLFGKVARGQVTAEADLPDRLETMLVARCLDLVGLARRAGGLVAGFDQVADWLRRGEGGRGGGAGGGGRGGRGEGGGGGRRARGARPGG